MITMSARDVRRSPGAMLLPITIVKNIAITTSEMRRMGTSR
jgi:hypothetical protein